MILLEVLNFVALVILFVVAILVLWAVWWSLAYIVAILIWPLVVLFRPRHAKLTGNRRS
jgi:hypothetical protein